MSPKGGARAGAGRKPKDLVKFALKLSPLTRDMLREAAKLKGMTMTDLIEKILKPALERILRK